jgi:hypothetical protein
MDGHELLMAGTDHEHRARSWAAHCDSTLRGHSLRSAPPPTLRFDPASRPEIVA